MGKTGIQQNGSEKQSISTERKRKNKGDKEEEGEEEGRKRTRNLRGKEELRLYKYDVPYIKCS